MVSHKEALNSSDIKVVKAAISGVKGQITKYTNRLHTILSLKKGNDFDLSQISHVEVSQGKLKIEENFKLFQQLQIRDCELRGGDDEEDIKTAEEEEEKVFSEVCSKVYPVLDSVAAYIASYDKSKDLSSKAEQEVKSKENETKTINALKDSIVNKELAQARALQKFNVEKEAALKVTALTRDLSDDEDISSIANIRFQPIATVRDSLKQSFDELDTLSNELCALLVSRGDAQQDITLKIKFDYAKEYKEMKDIFIDLGVMELAQTGGGSTSKIPSSLAKDSTSATPIKISKPDPIKFSGQPRDFAPFKREFEAIVVPRRDASDIGFHLKQAVPSKHRHLLNNIELSNYKEMMEVLRQEFGSRGKVVKSVTVEIDKMKVVTSDIGFVEFVEKLEKMKRDLESVNYLEDLTTASTITKIEEKLPALVKIDWKKIVIKEKFRDKSAKDNFDKLMEFLIDYREGG